MMETDCEVRPMNADKPADRLVIYKVHRGFIVNEERETGGHYPKATKFAFSTGAELSAWLNAGYLAEDE